MTDLRPPTPPPFDPVTCAECVFAQVIIVDHDADGAANATPVVECHRYPPTTIVTDNVPTMLWPQVNADDWCGEGAAPNNEEDTDE